jgi:hypothetical protein
MKRVIQPWQRLEPNSFGETMGPNSIIDEHLARVTDPSAHGSSLGQSLRDAVTGQISSNIGNEELFAHPLACWIETEVGLIEGEKLRRRQPMTLADAADKLAIATSLSAKKCAETLAHILSVMGRRENLRGGTSDRAFLAFKLRRFISGAGQVYSTLEPATSRRVVLEGQVFHPDDESARLYPTFFCRECGQEHHSVSIVGGKVIARPIDEPPSDEVEADGTESGYLVPTVNDDFAFSGDVSDYPDDWQETTPAGTERLKQPHRGKHEGQLLTLAKDGSSDLNGVPAWFFRGAYRFCPQCCHQPPSQARDINKLASLSAEGRSSATTLIVSTILSWMTEDGTLDAHTRKILGFTDNRQDAALQAGHFNDFIFVTLLRGAVVRAVRDAGAKGLADTRFGEAVRLALGFDLEQKVRLAEWMNAAFDQGLITFDDEGRPIASSELTDAAIAALQLGNAARLPLTPEHRVRLVWHRTNLWQSICYLNTYRFQRSVDLVDALNFRCCLRRASANNENEPKGASDPIPRPEREGAHIRTDGKDFDLPQKPS